MWENKNFAKWLKSAGYNNFRYSNVSLLPVHGARVLFGWSDFQLLPKAWN